MSLFVMLKIMNKYFQCKVGWAGDGKVCGPDSDLDRWPDRDLGCSDPKCRKVKRRCLFVYRIQIEGNSFQRTTA